MLIGNSRLLPFYWQETVKRISGVFRVNMGGYQYTSFYRGVTTFSFNVGPQSVTIIGLGIKTYFSMRFFR